MPLATILYLKLFTLHITWHLAVSKVAAGISFPFTIRFSQSYWWNCFLFYFLKGEFKYKCKVSSLIFIIPLRTQLVSVLSLMDSYCSNGVCQFSVHPWIPLQDLSLMISQQHYHTPMEVFKDSLIMDKLSSTYKSKGRQVIARVLVPTIYNFNHNF